VAVTATVCVILVGGVRASRRARLHAETARSTPAVRKKWSISVMVGGIDWVAKPVV
jgi:hypothetical protein